MAIAFGKRHGDVLRTIAKMLASEHPEIREHGQRNFASTFYGDAQGRQMPMYRMTADGLSELAMGFSGAKLKAWHAMRAKERQLAVVKAGNKTRHGQSPVMEDFPQLAEGAARDQAAKAVGAQPSR